jgi:site-specific DNA-methyltransferase (adenine-specific)
MASKYWSNDCAFSSEKDDWTTPRDLFEELDAEFHFTVDLCASVENALCEKFYTAENSCLDADFSGERVFCNPPYGSKTGVFVEKCANLGGVNDVVMLLPARTDTKYFHEYIYNKAEIRFIKGRLKFGGAKCHAPFPSMIVIFKGGKSGEKQISGI